MYQQEEVFREHKSKRKKIRDYLIRFLISLAAIFCLIKFGKIDLSLALKYLLKVNPFYFALAFLSYMTTMALAGLRFYFSSHVLGFQKNYFQLLQLNFVGTLSNNFLPTTFGGDALRGYYLKRGSHIPLSKAVACIIYERYTGMVILFWIASIGFLLQDFGIVSKSVWQAPKQLALFSHVGSIITIFVIPFLPQINKLILGRTNWIYQKVIEPFLVYWHDLKLMAKIIFLSILLQISVIICHYFIALSLNMNIPFSYYLIFYPLTTIAGFLIPSLNGLGIREGAYIYFLKKVSVTSDQALAFSICWLIILFIISFIGGIVYLFGDFREHKPLQDHQPQSLHFPT